VKKDLMYFFNPDSCGACFFPCFMVGNFPRWMGIGAACHPRCLVHLLRLLTTITAAISFDIEEALSQLLAFEQEEFIDHHFDDDDDFDEDDDDF